MRKSIVLLGSLLALTVGSSAQAATSTKVSTVNATIAAAASLTLSSPNLNFASADPDVSPNIAPTEGQIGVTVKARTGPLQDVTLTVRAGGDLSTGGATPSTIPINKLSWTGTGLSDGVMSSAGNVPVGSWTGPGTRSGQLDFLFENSYDYATGSYTATITYTLTAP